MILLDNNQLVIANIFQMKKQGLDGDPEDLLRHMLLNNYRLYRSKFKKQFGELVICHDSPHCWRKTIFPEYKAGRRKNQKESDVDWKEIHNLMDSVRSDIKENLPYKNIKVEGAEADDIIYSLCKEYHQQEEILIVSNDKDFQQLQIFPSVKQYSPMKKKYLVCENPKQNLINHIIYGDSSDGVPNILSDNDTFVDDTKRQKRITTKRLNEAYESYREGRHLEEYPINWCRNETLINLFKVPDKIQEETIESFKNIVPASRSGLLNYFIERKLKNLMENIEEF